MTVDQVLRALREAHEKFGGDTPVLVVDTERGTVKLPVEWVELCHGRHDDDPNAFILHTREDA